MRLFGKPVVQKTYIDPMDDPEAKRPVQPTPEGYAGQNIAYRGTEAHGVPAGDEIIMPDELEDDPIPPVVYAPLEKSVDPIPVTIVQEFSKERRRFRTIGFTVGTDPIQVMARNDQRRRVVIKNVSTGGTTLRIGFDQSLRYLDPNSFVLGDGTSQDLTTTEPIHLVSDGAAVTVNIIEEYVTQES